MLMCLLTVQETTSLALCNRLVSGQKVYRPNAINV
jgi:hypothetical protein